MAHQCLPTEKTYSKVEAYMNATQSVIRSLFCVWNTERCSIPSSLTMLPTFGFLVPKKLIPHINLHLSLKQERMIHVLIYFGQYADAVVEMSAMF